jgi:hypothetical protein
VHGFPVGHVRHNAEAMTSLGLVRRAAGAAELAETIRATLSTPRPRPARAPLPSAADMVMAAEPRIRPLPRWRLALRRLAPATASLFTALALSTSGGYALAAHVEDDLAPFSRVTVSRPEVAVVVRPSPRRVGPLVRRLAAEHLKVTLALPAPAAPPVARMASSAGIEIVPAVAPGFHSFRTFAHPTAVRRNGGERDVAYIAPDRGLTLGQYLLGRVRDGVPVRPLPEAPGSVRAGDVVEETTSRGVAQLDWRLGHRGIRVTTLGALLHDGA